MMESETWNKLKRSCPNILKKYESIINQSPPPFWLRYEILDIYILTIIALAFVVIVVIKLYFKYINGFYNNFGLHYSRRRLGNPCQSGESGQWVNNLIEWIRQQSTAFTDAGVLKQWAKLLTDEAEKVNKNPEMAISQIAFQNAIPYFNDFQTIQTCEKSISVHCSTSKMELPISIILFPSSNAPIPIQLKVRGLEGLVQFRINSDISCVDIEARFSSTKHTKVISSIKIEEMGLLEKKILGALTIAVLNLRVPLQFNLSNLCKMDAQIPGFERSVSAIHNGLKHSPHSSIYSESSLYEVKLLVKIIKACNLKSVGYVSFDPYCMISIDEPYQRHFTSVVRNTCNPFFDEHYIFSIASYSKQIKFEMYGRKDKLSVADQLIGKANLSIDDLRSSSCTKQTIALTPDPNLLFVSSGTIIADFIFLDSQSTHSSPEWRHLQTRSISRHNTTSNMDIPHKTSKSKSDVASASQLRVNCLDRLTVGESPNPSRISLSSNNSPLHLHKLINYMELTHQIV